MDVITDGEYQRDFFLSVGEQNSSGEPKYIYLSFSTFLPPVETVS